MNTTTEFYARNHPIDKFIDIKSNTVVNVDAIIVYDTNLDELIEVRDQELISAYCYYELNSFSDRIISELDYLVASKNPNWEFDSALYSLYFQQSPNQHRLGGAFLFLATTECLKVAYLLRTRLEIL